MLVGEGVVNRKFMHFFGNTQCYEMQSGYTELLANHIIGNKRTKKMD